MYISTIALYPFAIARLHLVRQCFDSDDARFFRPAILNGQLHLVSGLIDQQFLRAAIRPDALPVNRQHRITFLDIQAGSSQRRGDFAVGWIADDDMRDAIALIFSVVVPIYAQEALAIIGPRAILTAPLVSM